MTAPSRRREHVVMPADPLDVVIWTWRLAHAERDGDARAMAHCKKGLRWRWVPSASGIHAARNARHAESTGDIPGAIYWRAHFDSLLKLPSDRRQPSAAEHTLSSGGQSGHA